PWNQVCLSWPASSVTIPVDASPRGSVPSPRSAHHPTRIPRPWAVGSADVGHAQFAQCAGHGLAGGFAELLVVEREADRRLDQANVGTAVEARAAEAVGVDLLLAQQAGDGVGELDLPAGAAAGLLQMVEDRPGQDVAADHCQGARRLLGPWLLDHAPDRTAAVAEVPGLDDAVAAGLLARHVLHRDRADAVGLGVVGHLLERARAVAVPDQVVG